MDDKNTSNSKTFLTLPELEKYMESVPKKQFYWGPIAKGTVGIVVGPSKHFKTTLCENLAYSMAAGRSSFMGMEVNFNDDKIGLALLEESIQMRGDRHLKIIDSFSDEERERIKKYVLFLGDHKGYLTHPESWQKFCKDVQKANLDILVIDSLSRLINKKLSESENAQKVMRRLRLLSTELNITVIVVHHSTKLYDATFPEMDNIKGSTDVVQESDYAIGLGKQNGKICFRTIVARYSPEDEKFRFIEIGSNQRMVLKGQATAVQIKKASDARYDDSGPRELLDTFKQLSQEAEDGIVQTKDLIAKSDLNERQVHEYKRRLVKEDKIEMKSKGKYKLPD